MQPSCLALRACGVTMQYTHMMCNIDNAKLLQKVLEGDPAMTLIQLDVKEGNVNDIVNESIRSTYQVRHLYLSACHCLVTMLKQFVVAPSLLLCVMS